MAGTLRKSSGSVKCDYHHCSVFHYKSHPLFLTLKALGLRGIVCHNADSDGGRLRSRQRIRYRQAIRDIPEDERVEYRVQYGLAEWCRQRK